MNIVILATARNLRPASFRTIREELGVVDGQDTVTVVTAHRPYRPLPVEATLRTGADLSLRRHAIVLPVAALDTSEEPDDEAPGDASPEAPTPLPRRLAHGVAWRVRRVRFAVRDNPKVSRVRNSTKVRKVTNAFLPGGVSARFAINTVRAREVKDVLGAADVVVALDSHTHRAAWLLARRHPDPDVVVGTAAGRRVIAARRAGRADSSS